MKKSVSYWCFYGCENGSKDVFRAMDEAKGFGYEGIELAVWHEGVFTLDTPLSKVREWGSYARNIGLEIASIASAMFWKYNFTHPDKANNQKAFDIVNYMIEAAAEGGAKNTLIVPGGVDVYHNPEMPIVQYDIAYEKIVKALQKLSDKARQYGVCLGVENVGAANKMFLSPLEMKRMIEDVGSDYVGVYFDTANNVATGYPEHWIRILKDKIKTIHMKDYKRDFLRIDAYVDLLEGDINWPELMKALREINYEGHLVLEMYPPFKVLNEARLEAASMVMDRIMSLY
jgi:hexulose-6-phosphate isomerase